MIQQINFGLYAKTLTFDCANVYTADSIKVVPNQREKVEYEHEKLAGSRD